MAKSKPQELALEFLNDPKVVVNAEYRFINHEIGIINNFFLMKSDFFNLGQPYRAKEGRIIRGLSGEAVLSINLIKYTVSAQMMVIIPPNSIIELISITHDFNFQAIVPDNNFLPELYRKSLANSFPNPHFIIPLTEEEWLQTGRFFSLIWEVANCVPFRREAVQYLITALVENVWFIQNNKQNSPSVSLTRQEETFRRFIALVNEHSKQERNISFYADKLCLTPHYLSTIIREVSGQTVMQWINQAIILEAKVLLKHSDLLVFQISDELDFPNPSFFSKFFKRMTGMTPAEYQKRK
ncbi:AraC family transcriptional regulator [Bacteroides sp.]|uniref:helix-turn-helix domain-containing protein n=1 Tax=Bacteroides sp. TaxID=29523 RepID=UPI0026372F5F|nr:helix-turn-helix domain-containing protein [Bacteroides sp.]